MTNKTTKRKDRPSGGKPRGGGRKTMRCSRGGGPKNEEMKLALRKLNTAKREETNTQIRVKSKQATLTTKQKSMQDAIERYAKATTDSRRQTASNAQVRIQAEVATATENLDEARKAHAENEQKRQNAQDAYDTLQPLVKEELQKENDAIAEKTAAAKAEREKKAAAANAEREQKKADDAAAKKAKKAKEDAAAAAAAKKSMEEKETAAKEKAQKVLKANAENSAEVAIEMVDEGKTIDETVEALLASSWLLKDPANKENVEKISTALAAALAAKNMNKVTNLLMRVDENNIAKLEAVLGAGDDGSVDDGSESDASDDESLNPNAKKVKFEDDGSESDASDDDASDDDSSDDDSSDDEEVKVVDANTYYQNIPFFNHPIFNDENFEKNADFVSIVDTGFFQHGRWKDMVNEMYAGHVFDDEDQQKELHKLWKSAAQRDLSRIEGENVKTYLDMINGTSFDVLIASDNDYTIDFKWWVITKSDIANQVITSVCEKMNDTIDDDFYMWLRTYVIYEGFMCGTVDECRSNYQTRLSIVNNIDPSIVSIQSTKYTQLKKFLDDVIRYSFILWAGTSVELEEKDDSVGSVSANEQINWSISAGLGVTISKTGVLTLDSVANYKTAPSHTFTVKAIDADDNESSMVISVNVNNAKRKNLSINTTKVLATIDDGVTNLGSVSANKEVLWSISDGLGVSISNTGVLTLDTVADYQTSSSHTFTVNAVNAKTGKENSAVISVNVNDVNAAGPSINTTSVVATIDDGLTNLGSVSANAKLSLRTRTALTNIKSKGVESLRGVRRTRLRVAVRMRKDSIKKVVTTMKPTYYYWIIYDINNRLSKATRKYIYNIMEKSAVLDTPKKVCDTMFDIHNFARMNDSRSVNPFENIYKVYKNVTCVPFEPIMANQQNDDPSIVTWNPKLWERSSAWDMYVRFESIKFSTLYEEVDDNTQVISRPKMTELFNTLRTDAFQRLSYSFYFLDGSPDVSDDEYKYKGASQQVISVFSNFGEDLDAEYPYTLFGDNNKNTWNIALFRMFGDLLGKNQSDKRVRKVQRTTHSDGREMIELVSSTAPVIATPVSDDNKDDETIPMATIDTTTTESPVSNESSAPSLETNKLNTNNTTLSEFVYIFDEIIESYIKTQGGAPIDVLDLLKSEDTKTKYSNTITDIANEMSKMVGSAEPYEDETIKLPDEIANDPFSSVFIYFHLHSTMPANYHYAMLFGSIPCTDVSILNKVEGGLCWPPIIHVDGPGYGNLYKFVSISGLETLDDPDEKVNFFKQPTGTPPDNGYINRITQMDVDDKNNIHTATKQEMMEYYISPDSDANATQRDGRIERMDTWKLNWFDNPPSYKTLASIPKDDREKEFTFSDMKDFESRSKTVKSLITTYVGPHGVTFDDAMRKQMYIFYDKQMHGLLSSDSMKERMPEIMRKWEGFESVMLANREAGYIYWTRPQIIQYNMFKGMYRGHYPLAIYLEFAGMHSMPSPTKDDNGNNNPVMIHRNHALLWLDSPPSVKKTIEIANPRLYHGMMKHIWSGALPSPEIGAVDDAVVNDDKDDKDDKDDGRPVPVRIGGTVFTTVPGYQNMQISPSMFGLPKDKSTRDKVIRINPTVKLSQSAVNMSPEEDRKRQFFDYGLFYTLNSRAANQELMGISNISFKKSVKSHIIDNNIKITIDTLFAPGTVIYLGSEPYTVYSATFDETKWRLGPSDVIEPELNVENVMNAQMIQIQNKLAISEMQSMPDVLKVGDGITIAEAIPLEYKFVKGSDDLKLSTTSDISERLPTVIPNSTTSTEVTVVPKKIIKPITVIQNPTLDVPRLSNEPSIQIPTPPDEEWVPPKVVGVDDPLMEDVIVPMRDFFLYGPTMEYTVIKNNNEENDKAQQVFTRDMNYGSIKKDLNKYGIPKETVDKIASYLKQTPNYYDMLGTLNDSATEANLKDLFRIKKMTTAGKFNTDNYKRNTITGGGHLLQMIKIAGDGNCFFTCISHALNIYNYSNKDSPYVFHTTDAESAGKEVKRGGTNFTQEFIRWAVVNKYRQTPGLMAVEILNSCVHIDGPNDEFVNAEITRIEKIEHISPIALTKLNDLKNKIHIMTTRTKHLFGDDGWNAEINAGTNIQVIRQDAVGKTLFLEYVGGKKLTYPKTEEDAYKLLMSSHYYAQTTIIYMIQRLFTIKPIIIGKRDKEPDDVNITGLRDDMIYGDWKVRATRTYFKIEEPISIEEELDDNIDKVVFILQKDVHYSLFAFGPDLETQSNKPDSSTSTKTRRKRAKPSDIDRVMAMPTRSSSRIASKKASSAGGTRRRRYIKGGGNPNHVVIFKLNKMNFKAPHENTNPAAILDIIPKSMIFDSGPTQIPNYMVMLMYSNYNMIRGSQGRYVDRTMMKNYIEYRLFYTEFLIIDALIESMTTPSANYNDTDSSDIIDVNSSVILDKFIKKYEYVFAPNNLWSHPMYLPMVHQYKERRQLGGAPSNPIPGRDAMNNVTSSSLDPPNVATAVPMMNNVTPIMNTAIAMDPSNVLSEHVLRIMNDDSSTLSFKLDVHLIVAPGDNGISIADKVGYACESSKQDMSRSWSEITGKPYYPTARKE